MRHKNWSCPNFNRKYKQGDSIWLGMRFQNQQNKISRVQIVQVNEIGHDTIKEDDLHERENFTGKIEFLFWVEAHDCVKDKLTGYYAI